MAEVGRSKARGPAPLVLPIGDLRFFEDPADLRDWFTANHLTAEELWLGFHKVGSGRPSVTWPQAVDEALCVGWIDGIRKGIDPSSYTIRFTPRRKRSSWSAVNIGRIAALEAEGRMLPAGLRAFEARDVAKSAIYSYEQLLAALRWHRRGGLPHERPGLELVPGGRPLV